MEKRHCAFATWPEREGAGTRTGFLLRCVERAVRTYQIVATPYFLLVRTIFYCQHALPAVSRQ
jgi:hypothetical protein